MRALRTFTAAATIYACAGCDRQVALPTNPTLAAAPAPAPIDGVLNLASFAIGRLTSTTLTAMFFSADFTLREVAGGTAVVESLRFEDSDGHSDMVDAWCFGDAGIRLAPYGTLESRTLDYCWPRLPASAAESASLTIVYRNARGQHTTLHASAPFPH